MPLLNRVSQARVAWQRIKTQIGLWLRVLKPLNNQGWNLPVIFHIIRVRKLIMPLLIVPLSTLEFLIPGGDSGDGSAVLGLLYLRCNREDRIIRGYEGLVVLKSI